MTDDQAIRFFNDHAEELHKFYNSVEREEVLTPYLKNMHALFSKSVMPHLIDIGAGCGSDAFYLLDCFEALAITAVEPSDNLSQYAKTHQRLTWLSDILPDLDLTRSHFKEQKADAILMDAVFQYVAPEKRVIALQNCAACLHDHGQIYMNFPNQKTRDYQYTLNAADFTQAAEQAGLEVVSHEVIKPYNDRRSQSGKKLHFEYFILSKAG